ncbi:homoserine kinase [Motilibacter peucedani]|uniref:Homoserine kinase n=1 Tax=Motilibacter peucedani TaxID=598650 RepID=A0A420XLT0_9ACTN|nr:homoserine kinase [Motilibacter peucedani]RKS71373.1 homoserine kinase [Motilibacter peucedani]
MGSADPGPPAGRARLRVPATSANLGPGFDSLGLALSLEDTVEAEVLPAGSALEVTAEGEGAADVPLDAGHLVVRAMARGFDALGVPVPPPVRLHCTNRIPHGRGLGSSSAAIVAGLRLVEALCPGRAYAEGEALELASELEGHPDNVAPCLLGGFTVAWTDAGRARAVRLEPSSAVAAVVFVPTVPVSTHFARTLLPERVPHADAARNAGRAALLVEALTRRPELLLPATEDRLHQDYREPAMPASAALVRLLRADGVAAVVSGAGPTVLALVPHGSADEVARRAPDGFAARVLDLQGEGAGPL